MQDFNNNKLQPSLNISFWLPLYTILCIGQCHEIFCFRFFSWIFNDTGGKLPLVLTTPAANLPRVSTTPAANFATSSPCVGDTAGKFATGVNDRRQICRLCQRRRWQIMGTISGCRHPKVNLKAKIYIYASSTTQRWPNKIIKIFLIEDFFYLPPV